MKFQDEGPKLRQHFENSAQKPFKNNVSKSEQTWRANSSSDSSSASSSSPDADPSDMTAWQLAMREQPSTFVVAEDSLILAPGKDRWSSLFDITATPLVDSLGDFSLTEKDVLAYLDIKRQWTPSPLIQQEQLLYTFTSSLSATSTKPTKDLLPLGSHGKWLSYLPPLSGTNPLLDNAVRACTLAHLGRLNSSEHLMHQAQTYYGSAIRMLSTALQDITKGMSSETLSATILLSFYEMMASDSDQSWVRHAGGASTLMKMRGPARHRRGFDREIYLAYRHAVVIQCFEVQKPCFLDEPEWRKLSEQIFDDICASGVAGDRLDVWHAAETTFREMAPLPALACDARNIPGLAITQNTDSETITKSLVDRALHHRANLKGAHMRFMAAVKRLGHGPSSHMSGDPIFPVRYNYTNVFTGGICLGHWTILIVLDTMLKELDQTPGRSAMYQVEMAAAAQEICRSAAWMSTSSFLGPFLLTFALRVSLMALTDEARRMWILGQLRRLGATRLSMAKDIPFRDAHPATGMPRSVILCKGARHS